LPESSTIQIHVKADEKARVCTLRRDREFEDFSRFIHEKLGWDNFTAALDGHPWEPSGCSIFLGEQADGNQMAKRDESQGMRGIFNIGAGCLGYREPQGLPISKLLWMLTGCVYVGAKLKRGDAKLGTRKVEKTMKRRGLELQRADSEKVDERS
jgi:hypothetical protein